MGIREKLNENPGLTTGVTAGIIVIVLGIIIWQATGGGGRSTPQQTKVFYTIDDGQTWFADDSNKIPPFDYKGKPAVRCRVYSCDGGKTTFPGVLERYSAETKAHMERVRAANHGMAPMEQFMVSGMEYKKPRSNTPWVGQMTPGYEQVRQIVPPPGASKEKLQEVQPE